MYLVTMDILVNNREALEKISEYLIEKETITGDEFMKILNEIKNPEEVITDNNEDKA